MLSRRVLTLALLLAILGGFAEDHRIVASAQSGPTYLTSEQNFELPDGHFFKQGNQLGGSGDSGYLVLDDADGRFWSEFQRLGGVVTLGYPVSRRFLWRGSLLQVFQRAVLQWDGASKRAVLVNVFDLLHDLGYDAWLESTKSTPRQLDSNTFDRGKQWQQIVLDRQGLLSKRPAIKARYMSSPEPLNFFGLPTSEVVDNGDHYAVRLQRTVLQEWKSDKPWAKAGQVTVANGGAIAVEAGVFPPTGFDVVAPGIPWNGKKVALDPGHGGTEIGAVGNSGETRLLEKDLNLQTSVVAAAYLAMNGYRVVLTRNQDSRANQPWRDRDGDSKVALDDDLQARIDIANGAKADVLVSIHYNGFRNRDLRGSSVYYSPGRPFSDASFRLAKALDASLIGRIRSAGYQTAVDLGAFSDTRLYGVGGYLFVLGPNATRPAAMPGALGEALFLTNPEDAAWLARPAFVEQIGLGYAQGIANYFGLPFSENKQVAQPQKPPQSAPEPKPAPTVPPSKPPAAPAPTPAAPGPVKRGEIRVPGNAAVIRGAPSTKSPILGYLNNGIRLNVAGAAWGEEVNPGEDRWYQVSLDTLQGYTYAPLIVIADAGLELPPREGQVQVPAGARANVRSQPTTASKLVGSLERGDRIQVLDVTVGEMVQQAEPRWYSVRVGQVSGYVYGTLVGPYVPQAEEKGQANEKPTLGPASTEGKPVSEFQAKAGRIASGGPTALVRSAPKTTATVLSYLTDGTLVDVIEAAWGEEVLAGEDRWYRVSFPGGKGYVYGPLVEAIDPALALPPRRGTVQVATSGGANLRSRPTTGASVLVVLANEEQVEILDVVEGEAVDGVDSRWYRVESGQVEGYVYRSSLATR